MLHSRPCGAAYIECYIPCIIRLLVVAVKNKILIIVSQLLCVC